MTREHYQTYHGKIWYNINGVPIAETGSKNMQQAEKIISDAEKKMHGKWCFSLDKKMTQAAPRAREVWVSTVVFPDGKTRVLVDGEVPLEEGEQKGVWLTPDDVLRVYDKVRIAPSSSFAYGKNDNIIIRKQTFDDMIALERYCRKQTTTIFVLSPEKISSPEKGIHVYMAQAPY